MVATAPNPVQKEFRVQKGYQTQALSSRADIVVGGGAAGAGKTYAALLEPLRHVRNPNANCVIFRKTLAEVVNPGGIKDASYKIYPYFKGSYQKGFYQWRFPSGFMVAFRYLAREEHLLNYQGSEIALLQFDELTHFGEREFFYMLSRNRSTSGVRSYCRASTNPEGPSHWLTKFIDWWIGDDGFIIPERSGQLRWFMRWDEEIIWKGSPDDPAFQKIIQSVPEHFRDGLVPKSFTFVRGSVEENKELLKKDPGYVGNLMSLPYIDRMRLLEGNWKIQAKSGLVFSRNWFQPITKEQLPIHLDQALSTGKLPVGAYLVRAWDLAATEKEVSSKGDPCYTASVWVLYIDGNFYILNVTNDQISPAKTNQKILEKAQADTRLTKVLWEKEGGSSGKRDAEFIKDLLKGYTAIPVTPSGSKLTRAKPSSSLAERGKIFYVVPSTWSEEFLDQAHAFPDSKFKDMVDAFCIAVNYVLDREMILGKQLTPYSSFSIRYNGDSSNLLGEESASNVQALNYGSAYSDILIPTYSSPRG